MVVGDTIVGAATVGDSVGAGGVPGAVFNGKAVSVFGFAIAF
jgi:hypothetical protein